MTWHQWQVEYPIDKKIGFVLAARFREGFFPPGIPIDRIVRVLEKIG